MAEPRCFRCRFWQPTEGRFCGNGECRRYPPVHVEVAEFVTESGWPEVGYDAWCSEFELRKTKPDFGASRFPAGAQRVHP
jgi:hypothetical protein